MANQPSKKPRDPFHGRQRELKILRRLLTKRSASLVVLKGRRRIGKSRLAEEFVKPLKSYTFVGLPPEKKLTAKMQRAEFVKQMQRMLGLPGLKTDDWSDIFWHLAAQVSEGQVVIVLDEINWMGNKDPTFLGKLKTAWDTLFKKNPELIMILSGSMSTWIDRNILSSTGFLGRISTDLTLEELPLSVCNEFWSPYADRVSAYEKFKILAVTGGIPRYLEEVHPEWDAEENIKVLCFEKESILFKEFDRIFSDLFSSRSGPYRQIIARLAQGPATLDEVSLALDMKKGGTVSAYLEDLIVTGYVSRDFTWNLKSGNPGKLSHYRLRDNYLRFYLKIIEPNTYKILQNELIRPYGWDSIMGLQFENLVLNNRNEIKRILNLSPDDIVMDNPYFQRSIHSHAGCQIDYLIQTRYNSLHLCEIKFSKEKIGPEVIYQIQKKIDCLTAQKQFSIWPILIHVNGVTDSVLESGFFSRIIDFGILLNQS
jgi:AAA+ ATPase superfamily predicted ATPase